MPAFTRYPCRLMNRKKSSGLTCFRSHFRFKFDQNTSDWAICMVKKSRLLNKHFWSKQIVQGASPVGHDHPLSWNTRSYRFITPGARVSRPRRTKPMAPACSPDEMSPYVATFALISDFSTVARHPPSRLHGGGTVWTGVTGTSYMRCGAAGTQAAAGCCRHQPPA